MAEICPFETTPLAVPRFINNLPVYSLNYTNQDFYALRTRTLELLKTNFGNEFNDFSEASLAVMLIECWAGMADMLSFKIDQIANELFIDSVTELENAFRLCKLVGFRPMPPLPAKAMFLARTNAVYSKDLLLPTPILIELEGHGISYELYPADAQNNPVFGTEIVIPAGTMFTESVVGIEGMTKNTTFRSAGRSNQIFTLPFENVFFGSIKVKIDGVVWEEVEYFTESSPRPEYIVEYDAYYKPSLIFGDNKAGLVPQAGSNILVRFRVPNKTTSEIVSGAFNTKIFGGLGEVADNLIVNVTNYTKSEFGHPGDSIVDIKKKLPAFLRTQNRGVTGADYKFLTDNFATAYDGIIGKSNIVLRNHGCAGNVIDIVVLAKTGESRLIKANDNLKRALLTELNRKKIFTDHICIKDGEVVYVDVNINAHLNVKLKKLENDIKAKIVDKIAEYFDITRWEYGHSFKEKDVIKFLATIKEVKQFDIGFVTNKTIDENKGSEHIVTARYNELLRPDNVTINFTYESGEH